MGFVLYDFPLGLLISPFTLAVMDDFSPPVRHVSPRPKGEIYFFLHGVFPQGSGTRFFRVNRSVPFFIVFHGIFFSFRCGLRPFFLFN